MAGLELALVVLETTHDVEQLVVELLALRRVELLELIDAVATDLLDDAGGLGQLRCELREPLQGLVEVEVALPHLTNLVEDRERRLVVAKVVETLAEEELRLLHVRRSVLGFTLDDALKLHGRFLVPLLLIEAQRVGQRFARRTLGGRRRRLPGLLDVELHVLSECRVRSEDSAKRHDHDPPNHSHRLAPLPVGTATTFTPHLASKREEEGKTSTKSVSCTCCGTR